MPDSPSSTAVATSAWDAVHSSLPVSYQVAILLDVCILFATLALLLLLALYIRKQIKQRQNQNEDLEMKGSVTGEDMSEGGIENKEGEGKKRSMLGKFTRKKGHVRWTSSVEQCSELGGSNMSLSRVKMKAGAGEWETDTWGPNAKKAGVEIGVEEMGTGMGVNVGMRGGGKRLSGFQIGAKERAGVIGEWQRGSLWKGVEARREKKKERNARRDERAAAGYDGYRGN